MHSTSDPMERLAVERRLDVRHTTAFHTAVPWYLPNYMCAVPVLRSGFSFIHIQTAVGFLPGLEWFVRYCYRYVGIRYSDRYCNL